MDIKTFEQNLYSIICQRRAELDNLRNFVIAEKTKIEIEKQEFDKQRQEFDSQRQEFDKQRKEFDSQRQEK